MITSPTKYKFTVDGLILMEEAGLFPPDYRIELLNGEIIEMSPIKSHHAYAVTQLTRFFYQHLSTDHYFISVQNPIQLSEHSLPQPDLVVARHREGYANQHIQATDVILLIEVSDSTYRFDRDTKLKAYATAEIPEYWIVNIPNQQIEVYTQPEGDYYKQTVIQKHAFTTSLDLKLDPSILF